MKAHRFVRALVASEPRGRTAHAPLVHDGWQNENTYEVFTLSDIVRLFPAGRTDCGMTVTEIYTCLRDLQVVATVPHISEDQIAELVKRKLIQRTGKTGGIWLTQLGVYTKTGAV